MGNSFYFNKLEQLKLSSHTFIALYVVNGA